MIEFRDLTADDIEVRVQSVKQNGLVLLLYKNARVDMNILDETVGAENWQREHYECKGNLFCRVGICCKMKIDESGNDGDIVSPSWVYKSDCGTESNTEAQKGEASDSFKRACFNWGIGRELYTSPFIWVKAENCKIDEKKDRNGKTIYVCNDKFVVEKIIIEDKRITALEIWNVTQKKMCFVWGKTSGESGEDSNCAEPLTYETALSLVINFGDHKGKTLSEIWKTDVTHINWLLNNAYDERIKEAIRIIDAEIKARKRAAADVDKINWANEMQNG